MRKALKNQTSDIKTVFADGSSDYWNQSEDYEGRRISLLQYAIFAIAFLPTAFGIVVQHILVRPFYALTGIYRPMSDEFVKEFCACCRKVFPRSSEDEGHCDRTCYYGGDLYWLVSCFLAEHTEKHSLSIKHWLNLYSFARNLSASFLLLYIVSAGMRRMYDPSSPSALYYWWPVVAGTLCALLLHRYVYLYYKYYSKFQARAFVAEVKARDYFSSHRIVDKPKR